MCVPTLGGNGVHFGRWFIREDFLKKSEKRFVVVLFLLYTLMVANSR